MSIDYSGMSRVIYDYHELDELIELVNARHKINELWIMNYEWGTATYQFVKKDLSIFFENLILDLLSMMRHW